MKPLAIVAMLFTAVAVFATPLCLAFQAYIWLKSGTWFDFNTVDLFFWTGLLSGPQFNHLYENWRGVVKILQYLNAGVSVSIFFGLLAAMLSPYASDT